MYSPLNSYSLKSVSWKELRSVQLIYRQSMWRQPIGDRGNAGTIYLELGLSVSSNQLVMAKTRRSMM